MAFVGLDLGSTYTKIARLEGNQITAERQLPTPACIAPGSRRFEIDADAYFNQVKQLLDAFLTQGVKGILFSTQMHGYVLTDEDMNPVTPYCSWQDGLGTAYLPLISQRLSPADVQPSGVPLKGNLALCSLLARMEEGLILPANTLFHTLGGYMIGRLTRQFTCHMTNAAPTGMADIQKGGWHTALIEKACLTALRFPKLEHHVRAVGEYRGIPVYPDLGDQQVCALGAGLAEDGSLHVNIGTAGLIGALSRTFLVEGCESRPWLEPGVYLRTVTGLLGGRHVSALNARLGGDLPHVWQMMTMYPTEEVQALYEEIARQYRASAEQMQVDVKQLRYSGGCAEKNPALRATMQRVFQLQAEPEMPVCGIWEGMLSLANKLALE